MLAQEPQRFGKYQIVERIAAGGMAEIFKARLDGIGGFHRTFAIKRILPHLTTNPEFVDMLVDEAKIAGLLSHANIVQILDLGSIDQQYYIAMEYVHGRDLGQLLARCAEKGITLPVPHAVYLLLEMLKGLEYAHNRQVMRGGRPVPLNIIHRDISPANVLVSFQGEVKLTDFGIAKASVKALETMSGVVKGRFDYMSPEQASGGDLDQRSDLYSAGVVLYQVLTGRHPFRQPGELATIEAIRRGAYEAPSYVNPDVPYALDLVVEQALKVNPAERYGTATAFKDALDRFFHDAGFIFSASTLAAFLKGLFPESEVRPSGAPVLAPARAAARLAREGADAPDDVVLDEESSAGRRRSPVGLLPGVDSTVQDVAGLLRGLPDASQSGAFGPVAGLADESTLIRPSPGSDPKEWSDAATALRPDPTRSVVPPTSARAGAQPAAASATASSTRAPATPGRAPGGRVMPPPGIGMPRPASGASSAPTPGTQGPGTQGPSSQGPSSQGPSSQGSGSQGPGGPSPGRPGAAQARPTSDTSASPGSAPGAARGPRLPASGDAPGSASAGQRAPAPRTVARTPAHVHLLYLAVAVFASVAGLGVGVLAGRASASRAPDSPVVVKLDPLVEIHFPEGSTVTVDGHEVPGASPVTATLSAGRPAVVRVTGPAHAPAETQLTLDYNQMRVLDYAPVDLKKKEP